MTNKNNLLLAGVVVLVLVLLAWPAITRRNKTAETPSPADTTNTENEITVLGPAGLTEAEMIKFESDENSPTGDTPPAPGMIPVKVFLHDAKRDPSYMACDKVYPSTRWINSTPAVARAAMAQLLRGITPAESKLKLTSALNEGVTLNNLVIENGVAKADFNDTLTKLVAGSCRVQAIRAQITETLKQFPGVTSVTISVNGQNEGVLQP